MTKTTSNALTLGMNSCGGSLDASLVGLGGGLLLLPLRGTLGQHSLVFSLLLFLAVHAPAVEATEVTAALETDGGDETLDFGSLGVGLGVLLLCTLDLTPDNVLPDVILLGQVEESPDLGCPLRAKPLREDVFGQAWEGVLALLDDDEGQDGDIGTDNASPDGLALALTSAAGAVARVAVGEEELHSAGKENTLLHRETLLVVATGNAENVAFELITERIGGDLLGDLLVVEDTDSALVVDVNGLLFPSCGVGDVELHAA